MTEPDSGYSRLEQQIDWYDRKSLEAQKYYKWSKLAEFCFAGLVPLIAGVNAVATALLGAAIIVLEGLQHINQWSQNWITYRSTCEALRHEKYLFLGQSGVYQGLEAAQARSALVERVEALISTEHAKWISRQEYGAKKDKQVQGE